MFARQLPRIPSTSLTVRWASTTVQKRAPKHKKITAVKATPKVQKTPFAASAAAASLNAATSSTSSTSAAAPSPPPPTPPKTPANTIDGSEVFNIKLPGVETIPEPPVQIPFVPDFWDSKRTETTQPFVEPEQPKIVVVGGAGTHHGGGPSHNLSEVKETVSRGDAPAKATEFKRSDSIFDDIAEDLHLPPVNEIKNSFWKMFS